MIQSLVIQDRYSTVHEAHIFHTFQIHTNTVPTNISVGIDTNTVPTNISVGIAEFKYLQ